VSEKANPTGQAGASGEIALSFGTGITYFISGFRIYAYTRIPLFGGVPDFDGRQEMLSSMPRIIGWPRKSSGDIIIAEDYSFAMAA